MAATLDTSCFITFDVIFLPNRTKAEVVPAPAIKSDAKAIDADAIPAEAHASWSWDEVNTGNSMATSGITGLSDNSRTREVAVLSESSSFWSEPGFIESLKPLMNGARSLYSVYEHWAGLPRLQVTVSLL